MNTKVMKCAVNYDKVVNFIYEKDDFITDRIINYYVNYVLSIVPKERYKVKSLDMIIEKFLTDTYFNSYVRDNIADDTDYYYDLDYVLSRLYKEYMLKESRKVAINRWL